MTFLATDKGSETLDNSERSGREVECEEEKRP
jgi:hypothetical protein